MRTWGVAGVHGLPTSIAATFHRLTKLRAPPARKRAAADLPASSGLAGLPEITFDLSFLSEPPPAGLAIAATEAAPAAVPASEAELPEITFDLSSLVAPPESQPGVVPPQALWRERSLEDWFRQRATEVAQRARERREPSPLDALAPLGRAG
jgi:hypothetical protein